MHSFIQDPEDDDAPLQPNVFVENLWDGIARGSANEVEGEEKNDEDDGKHDKHVILPFMEFQIMKLFSFSLVNARLVTISAVHREINGFGAQSVFHPLMLLFTFFLLVLNYRKVLDLIRRVFSKV